MASLLATGRLFAMQASLLRLLLLTRQGVVSLYERRLSREPGVLAYHSRLKRRSYDALFYVRVNIRAFLQNTAYLIPSASKTVTNTGCMMWLGTRWPTWVPI